VTVVDKFYECKEPLKKLLKDLRSYNNKPKLLDRIFGNVIDSLYVKQQLDLIKSKFLEMEKQYGLLLNKYSASEKKLKEAMNDLSKARTELERLKATNTVKLTKKEVLEIRYGEIKAIPILAKTYSVSEKVIKNILEFKTYKSKIYRK
jgi:predicted nuclease with TOPRIM domain